MALPRSVDPFDIPLRVLPIGMMYQWCGKEPAARYQKFFEAGWRAVPYDRHPEMPNEYRGADGFVQHGGMVLMERPREETHEAREMDMDRACLNAGNGRQVAINIVANVHLSHEQLDAAKACGISGQKWAAEKFLLISDGSDPASIEGRDGALRFVMPSPPPTRIVSKYRWLDWLFNLISTEE